MNTDSFIKSLEAQLAEAKPWERLTLQRDQLAQLIAAYKLVQETRRETREG